MMRGDSTQQANMLLALTPEDFVPQEKGVVRVNRPTPKAGTIRRLRACS